MDTDNNMEIDLGKGEGWAEWWGKGEKVGTTVMP